MATVWENLFDALADPHRRQLLVAVLNSNPQDGDAIDPLDELTYSENEADRLRTALVHKHLPKLDEMGYIEWDTENGTFSKGPRWDEIAPLLELIHEHRDELPDDWN